MPLNHTPFNYPGASESPKQSIILSLIRIWCTLIGMVNRRVIRFWLHLTYDFEKLKLAAVHRLCAPRSSRMRILLFLHSLTPSMPAVPNCCCWKGSAPYWSNIPFLPECDYVMFGSLLSQFRLSVVCRLSSVCNVGAPYSEGWTFRQNFFTAVYAGHPLTSVQNFTEIVLGEPVRRER